MDLFKGWEFLVGEIVVFLIAAAAIGLIAGWLIRAMVAWGDARAIRLADERVHEKEDQIALLENDYLKLKRRYNDGLADAQDRLEASERVRADLETQLARIEGDHSKELSALRSSVSDRDRRILDLETGSGASPATSLRKDMSDKDTSPLTEVRRPLRGTEPTRPEAAMIAAARSPAPTVVPLSAAAAGTAASALDDTDQAAEEKDVGAKPDLLTEPRDGSADDLKKIIGIGPKIELQLNLMGIFHFDQVAALSDANLDWVDANLNGFDGRARRDNWVPQAKVLADATNAKSEPVSLEPLKQGDASA